MSFAAFVIAAHAAAASCGCVWEKIRAVEAAREAKDSAALKRHVAELNDRYWDDAAGWFRLRPDADSPHDLWASACTMPMPMARNRFIERMLKNCAAQGETLLKGGDLLRVLPGEPQAACACRPSDGSAALGHLMCALNNSCPQLVDRVFAARHARGEKLAPGEERVQRSRAVAKARLETRWTKGVTPDNAWRTYPRPQMVRADWTCLNGLWDYSITKYDAAKPARPDGRILVPFPVESRLSGVERKLMPDELLRYSRTFRAAPRPGERTLLHFEGVDFRTQVFVNGREVTDAPHDGGDSPFSYDVTEFLRDGENALDVIVWDPSDTHLGPTGKQTLHPTTCFFGAASGIWKTVWTETVPATYVADYRVETDADAGTVTVTPVLKGDLFGARCTVTARRGTAAVSAPLVRSDGSVTLALPKPVALWDTETPNLYDLEIAVTANGRTDTVRGFFGVRKVEVRKAADGFLRVHLNGRPIYLLGTLDQGWWPDGLTAPPCEDALNWDADFLKRAGFNCVRKHIKVEPRAFYAHCDRIGLLVLQDMPSWGTDDRQDLTPEANARYTHYRLGLAEMVAALRNHPSVVMWIPYNEGWGQPGREQTRFSVNWLKDRDPSRLVDPASGWNDWEGGYGEKGREQTAHLADGAAELGDIVDLHQYPGPAMPAANANRASFLGEFGAVGCALEGHYCDPLGRYHRLTKVAELDSRALVAAYDAKFARPQHELKRKGLCGSIYCETTDVFWESGGFVTFDRLVEKLPADLLKPINDALVRGE